MNCGRAAILITQIGLAKRVPQEPFEYNRLLRKAVALSYTHHLYVFLLVFINTIHLIRRKDLWELIS